MVVASMRPPEGYKFLSMSRKTPRGKDSIVTVKYERSE